MEIQQYCYRMAAVAVAFGGDCMNAVIYARYSSDKQTEQSIEGQLRYCYDYAKRCGYTVVGEYIDRAISGTSDQRPQFQKMIADSAKKQFQFVIVWKLDRFSRNRYDSAIYKNKLKKNGVRVVSATEGIGEGDESIILEAVLEAMAETYSRQLSQNVRRGMKESALKGNSTGGIIPLGYKLVDKRLAIDERTAPIVQYIFQEYANGTPKADIARNLNEKGYRTSTGGKFTVNSFTTILSNRKYIGYYTYNGEVEIKDGCPAIIDEELFNKCKQRTARNRRSPASKKAIVEYVLNGKLFCGYCKSPMIGDSATSSTGTRYYYYSCAGRKNKKTGCKKKRENKDFIEWYVVEQTVLYVLDKRRIEMIAERVVDAYNNAFSDNEIKNLEKQIRNVDKELDKLADALIDSQSEKLTARINEKALQLESRRDDLQAEITKQRIACEREALKKDDIVKWLKGFCNGDLFDKDFRQRIIDTFINAVFLYDDKLLIFYNIRDGEQVCIIEDSNEIESALSATESSDLNGNGSPKRNDNFRQKIVVSFCSFLF